MEDNRTKVNYGQSGRRRKKKKGKLKRFFAFILFEIVFTAVVGPFYLYYGPFENVKRGFVGAAMTSYRSQFLAKWFLSDEKINEILAESGTVEEISQDVKADDVRIPVKHDTTIERYDVQGNKFKGYLLVIKDPSRVSVGYTSKMGKSGETVSQIAENNDAIAAINAGGFADTSDAGKWTGTGGIPIGVIVSGGKLVFNSDSEDTKADTIALSREGRLIIGKYSYKELQGLSVKDALTFGPALVVNGKPTIKSGDGGWGIAPRTAIAQKEDGSIMFLVIDGRQIFGSVGASLKETQDLLIKYGAVNAANLDGGKSTTMYLNGEVINTPSDSLGERSVPTAFIVK